MRDTLATYVMELGLGKLIQLPGLPQRELAGSL